MSVDLGPIDPEECESPEHKRQEDSELVTAARLAQQVDKADRGKGNARQDEHCVHLSRDRLSGVREETAARTAKAQGLGGFPRAPSVRFAAGGPSIGASNGVSPAPESVWAVVQ